MTDKMPIKNWALLENAEKRYKRAKSEINIEKIQ